MRRPKKVEGLILDLTRIPDSGTFVLDDLIVTELPLADHCDVCKSDVVGCFRVYNGKPMCGLCRAIHKQNIGPLVITRLLEEYAKPCTFCGDTRRQKHFDHINMFSKADCVGIMVEKGQPSDDIMAEINKCQILCVPCHRKVTSYEARLGFISKKRQLNRLQRQGGDISVLKDAYFTAYSVAMEPYYAWLAGARGSRGELRGILPCGDRILDIPI